VLCSWFLALQDIRNATPKQPIEVFRKKGTGVLAQSFGNTFVKSVKDRSVIASKARQSHPCVIASEAWQSHKGKYIYFYEIASLHSQ